MTNIQEEKIFQHLFTMLLLSGEYKEAEIEDEIHRIMESDTLIAQHVNAWY